MEAKTILVLSPLGKASTEERDINHRPRSLNGLVIGLLDNGKPSFDLFLATLEQSLARRFNFAQVVRRRKGDAGRALPKELLDELAHNCHLVVNGIGD